MTLPTQVDPFDAGAVRAETGQATADAIGQLANALNGVLARPRVGIIIGRNYGYENATYTGADKLRNTTNNYTKIGRAIALQYDGQLLAVSLLLFQTGAPSGHVFMSVQGDAGTHQPDDVDRSVSALVPIVGVDGQQREYLFTFATPVAVKANALTWLVIQGDYTISATDYLAVNRADATVVGIENPTDFLNRYAAGWTGLLVTAPCRMQVYQRIFAR